MRRNVSPVRARRGNAILLVVAVGLVFLGGLAVHGAAGGVLLLLVAATLVLFSARAWPHVRREGRPFRIIVLAAVIGLAVAKLLGRL
jgi:hypothetical protein